MGPLERWASMLAGLSGWRRHLCSFMAGAVATLALPPLFALPALVVALCVLLWLWDGATKPWAAARLGWSFGFGFFAFGLYWIGFAFLVEAERFALLMPVAVLAMAGGLALFPALVLAAVQGLALTGATRLFAFGLAWLVSEWLRAWVFTGFPWNQLGSVWAFSPATLQVASLGGVWLLTVLAVLAAGAPSLLADGVARRGGRTARLALVAGLSLALPLLSAGWGAWRLAEAPAPEAHQVEDVRLRLVQPAIPQALKWRSELRRQHVVRQMELSTRGEGTAPSHIIWAETAVPYLMSGEPELARAIARVVPPGGALITGAPRSAVVGHQSHTWNSLHALDPTGRITATYDKNHLVALRRVRTLQRMADLGPDRARIARLHARPPAPQLQRGGPAAGQPPDMLRGDLSRRGAHRRRHTAGLAAQCHQRCLVRYQQRGRINISPRHGYEPWRRGCPWCGSPTPESLPPSMPMAGFWCVWTSGSWERSTAHCRFQPPSLQPSLDMETGLYFLSQRYSFYLPT